MSSHPVINLSPTRYSRHGDGRLQAHKTKKLSEDQPGSSSNEEKGETGSGGEGLPKSPGSQHSFQRTRGERVTLDEGEDQVERVKKKNKEKKIEFSEIIDCPGSDQ